MITRLNNTVTYSGFCVINKTAFGFDYEFIGPSYNWLQQVINHYLTHCHLLSIGHPKGNIQTSS
jgi:hypothetical protein